MNNAQITNENHLPALPMQSLEELHSALYLSRIIKAIKAKDKQYCDSLQPIYAIDYFMGLPPYNFFTEQRKAERAAYYGIASIEHDEAAIQSHLQNFPPTVGFKDLSYVDVKSLGQQLQMLLRGQRNSPSSLICMPNGFHFEPIWAHVPMPERMSHSGKKQWEQVAFLTEKGLMFANDEAMFKYIALHQAGKVKERAVKFYVDTTEWEVLRRIFRYSQQLPVERFVFYSAEAPNISSFEVINF